MRPLLPLLALLLTGCGGDASAASSTSSSAPQLPGDAPPALPPEGDSGTAVDLGFLMLGSERLDHAALQAGLVERGFDARPVPDEDRVVTWQIGEGAWLMLVIIGVPHPDAPTMARSPMSVDDEEIAAAPAHAIVTVMGLDGDVAERDRQLCRLLAAVVHATDAVGAMTGHGILFYKARLFADLVDSEPEGRLCTTVCVDLTTARESEDRFSFLTHGLQRYGREEFYVTCPNDGDGAFDFVIGMATWMIADPGKQLPTGDTVGRTAEERIEVQRVPSPTGEGPDVIRLDLP